MLERFLPYRLSVLSNTVSKAIAKLYADRFGITIPEWRVMAVLGRFGPSSAAEICAATAMDKVQVSRALHRLSESRLITRHTDKADRRRATVEMTAKGRTVYDEIVPLARSREGLLLQGLSPDEQKQLDHLLKKLAAQAGMLAGE
jgi:DNA-binding MarR family transcriptional regulator